MASGQGVLQRCGGTEQRRALARKHAAVRVRDGDVAPVALLAKEIARLEPQQVYFPLGVGGHVDHQLCREVALGMLGEGRRWVMPGPDYAGRIQFYEDFPYSYWQRFDASRGLEARYTAELPPTIGLTPELADIGDVMEQKSSGAALVGRTTAGLLTIVSWLFLGTITLAQYIGNFVGKGAEFAADTRAVEMGFGKPLMRSLRRVVESGGGERPTNWRDRLVSAHPPARTRIARIDAALRRIAKDNPR